MKIKGEKFLSRSDKAKLQRGDGPRNKNRAFLQHEMKYLLGQMKKASKPKLAAKKDPSSRGEQGINADSVGGRGRRGSAFRVRKTRNFKEETQKHRVQRQERLGGGRINGGETQKWLKGERAKSGTATNCYQGGTMKYL